MGASFCCLVDEEMEVRELGACRGFAQAIFLYISTVQSEMDKNEGGVWRKERYFLCGFVFDVGGVMRERRVMERTVFQRGSRGIFLHVGGVLLGVLWR